MIGIGSNPLQVARRERCWGLLQRSIAATSSKNVKSRGDAAIKIRLLAAACVLFVFAGDYGAAAAEAAGMAVSVVRVRSACFDDTIKLTGHVVPRAEVFVLPDVEGYHLAKVLVADGETVHVGQDLAELAKPDWLPAGLPAKAWIKAPANGLLIMSRPVPVGMPISAHAEPQFRIVRDGAFEIDIEIPKAIIGKIKAGESVQIATLDGNDIAGTVRVVDARLDFQTQLAHARVQVAGKPKLRDGIFVTARVDIGRDCAAAVPRSAVLYRPEGAAVQVVEKGHVETRSIEIGLSSGSEVEIRKGVKAGDLVVVRAGPFLNKGDAVRSFPLAEPKTNP